MTIDRQQQFEAHVERALADLEQRLIASRRRERRATAICVLAAMVALTGWTPLIGQAPKTVEQRVSDLEERTGGVQIEDGTTRLTAPLEIYDNQGRLVAALNSSDGEGLLAVGGQDRGLVVIGTAAGGGGLVRTHGANRKVSVAVGSPSGMEGRGVFVMDDAGNQADASLVTVGNNQPRLYVGNRDAGGVTVSVGNSNTGLISVRDTNGEPGVIAGSIKGVRMGVYAMNPAGIGVSLSGDKAGGRIQVHNPQGIAVGGLFSEFTGGGLTLTAETGGHSIVDLGVRAGGGSVRVFSVGGGTTRAALEADDRSGGFAAYADDGTAAVTLTGLPSGSGKLQLLKSGVTFVEAGLNQDGGGEVRAGPRAPQAVGGLAIPYRIVGRK
jgi:hypothetical protein